MSQVSLICTDRFVFYEQMYGVSFFMKHGVQGVEKKNLLRFFWQFSQQSLGISKRNFTNIFGHICAHNGNSITQLAYFISKLSALQ